MNYINMYMTILTEILIIYKFTCEYLCAVPVSNKLVTMATRSSNNCISNKYNILSNVIYWGFVWLMLAYNYMFSLYYVLIYYTWKQNDKKWLPW